MKLTANDNATAGAKSSPTTTHATTSKERWRPSKDGRWRTSLGHAGLMQFIPSGTYYARVKLRGKSLRASLATDVFATAKLRLPDKLKELRKPKAEVGTFGDGRIQYEAETRHGYNNRKKRFVRLAPLSITYRLRCLDCLVRSLVECRWKLNWKEMSEPEREGASRRLDALKVDEITQQVCLDWQKLFSSYSPTVFNNTLNTLRRVLELAGLSRGDNPAYEIGRMDILENEPEMPRAEQFDGILSVVETSGAAQAKDCADLIRFLAFTGARISEAKMAVWSDVDWDGKILRIHSVKVRGRSNGEVTRSLPFNRELEQLLERLNPKHQATGRICVLGECQGALTRACKLVGCQRLTHHDLRHYFVTKCLQAGVDVYILSKWVGHKDGGKLLLKVYSHLQTDHSRSMAAKVTFGAVKAENIIDLPKQEPATA